MASYGLFVPLIVLIVQTCAVYGQGEIVKSSLAFVIDNTGSMGDEIRQLRELVDRIFDTVTSSKASQIENFVLVTFNDPDVQLRTITKDRDVFKAALADVQVHGGGDCPEYALTGIETALNSSLPLSYLYVFTDASAKDYENLDQVRSIAQKKQSQIVFILTGTCGLTSDADYQVYNELAQATDGQAFSVMKEDVKDVIKCSEETVKSRRVVVINGKYPAGTHKVKFNVDDLTPDVLISVTGPGSRIGEVTGPSGIQLSAEPIVTKDKLAVKKLSISTPGDYELEIEGRDEIHIIIAKRNLQF